MRVLDKLIAVVVVTLGLVVDRKVQRVRKQRKINESQKAVVTFFAGHANY